MSDIYCGREFCLLRRDVPGTTAVLRTDSLSARPRGTDYREGCCSYELVQFFAGRHYDHRDDNGGGSRLSLLTIRSVLEPPGVGEKGQPCDLNELLPPT